VLLSDGRPTAGERRTTALAPRLGGLPVHTIAIQPERTDAAVTAVSLDDSNVRPGATTGGSVELDGGAAPFRGELLVRVDGELVHAQEVELEAGASKKVPFTASIPLGTPEGELQVEAELVPEGASDPVGAGSAPLAVGDKPRVLLLTAEPKDAELLATALRAEAMQIDVRTLDGKDFPKQIDKETDLVIIVNAPAGSASSQRGMSEELLISIAKWVDEGGGLIVTGGPRAFDLGGYQGSPIERVLPIRLDPVDPLTEPAATIVAVLDQSGSMGAHVSGGKTKMELADEAVFASIQMLRPFDYVGLTTVTTQADWDVPVQPVSDALDLEKKILSIRSEGGGIYVYTGLEAAYAALADAPTPLKHVLLFSDCADSEEKVSYSNGKDAQDLAAEKLKAGVTLSVVGIGEEMDPDTAWLKELAANGGGKFYLTNDATKLRALFVQETERLVDTSVQEVKFKARVGAKHPMIAGIDYTNAPELDAYQRLQPRKTSEVVLLAPDTDPLLVTWRYGLGHVVVWSSDVGVRWAKSWASWDGFNKQWTQVARHSLRSRAGGSTAVEVDFSGGAPVARLVRRDAGGLSLAGSRAHAPQDERRARRSCRSERASQGCTRRSSIPSLSGVQELEVVDAEGKVVHIERFVVPPPRGAPAPDPRPAVAPRPGAANRGDVRREGRSPPPSAPRRRRSTCGCGPTRSCSRRCCSPSTQRSAACRAWCDSAVFAADREVLAAAGVELGLVGRPGERPARVEPKIELGIEAVRDQHVEPLEVAAIVLLAVPQVEQRAVDVPDAPAHVREQTIGPALEVGARTSAQAVGLEGGRAAEHGVRRVEIAVAEDVGVVEAVANEHLAPRRPRVATVSVLEGSDRGSSGRARRRRTPSSAGSRRRRSRPAGRAWWQPARQRRGGSSVRRAAARRPPRAWPRSRRPSHAARRARRRPARRPCRSREGAPRSRGSRGAPSARARRLPSAARGALRHALRARRGRRRRPAPPRTAARRPRGDRRETAHSCRGASGTPRG
jgi:uncharacterized membrane protein